MAGNHDSPARLEAPARVLAALSVHVVGFLPRAEGELDVERLVVPLRERSSGDVSAWVAAVPFLRLGDIPGGDATPAGVVDGIRTIYASALDVARAKREDGQALLATGHCYVEGMRLSDESERKVLGGNQHPLPVDLFPADFDYVALGHLHFPQQVGGRGNVRYSGSPLPLSLDEAVYPHQVCLVELDGERRAAVKSVRVPRSVPILRLPDEPAPLAEILALLETLPPAPPREAGEPDRRPWLEVRVLLEGSEYGYQGEIAEVLEGRAARLVKITPHRAGSGGSLADGTGASLSDLTPEKVFRKLWERGSSDPVPADLEAAFHELVDVASQEERS